MPVHTYDCIVRLFVCIKRPLTAIGGGGGADGVFALAAFQHSTFLCDIQYCDLRKPALQRSSPSLPLSLSLRPHFLFPSRHLPTSLSIIYSAPFSYLHLGNSPSSTTPPPPCRFIFPPLSNTFSSTPNSPGRRSPSSVLRV